MEKYILVSLDERKSKGIANVTSRKILDFLGEHDKASPLKISKKLKLPLSTVTYNLEKLSKAGLVEKKDFAWSEKGKKVFYYSIVKKIILIAPKGVDWKDTLKKIIPVGFFGIIASYLTYVFTRVSDVVITSELEESSVVMTESSNVLSSTPSYWLYVLLLMLIVIIIILFFELKKRKK